jgi:hypothetical protein
MAKTKKSKKVTASSEIEEVSRRRHHSVVALPMLSTQGPGAAVVCRNPKDTMDGIMCKHRHHGEYPVSVGFLSDPALAEDSPH